MTKPQLQKGSLFSRFKKSLLKFLFGKTSDEEEEIKLALEVQRNADEILSKLRAIKQDLKHSVDGKLFTHIEDVVDPIAARIRAITNRLGNGKEEIKELDLWINKKVRPFVESFDGRNDDKKAIEKAILTHIVEMSTRQIDTDLKVIKDDQAHKLCCLDMNEQEKLTLETQVNEALAPIVNRWLELRNPPKRLTLENLNFWKQQVDLYRNQYYQAAIDLIDSFIPDSSDQAHDTVIENFTQIEDLENTLPELLEALDDPALLVNDRERLAKRLKVLVTEAHKLELDLQLTPELFDRLKKVKKGLSRASKLLSG